MLIEEIKSIAKAIPAELKEDKDLFTLEYTVGERKIFLLRQKFVYSAKLRIDENKKEVRFTEMLDESGFRFSVGMDAGRGLGFSFKKKETPKTEAAPKEGTSKEPSEPSGKDESYTVDFSKIRKMIEAEAVKAGYTFKYRFTSLGL